jgi:hypothetical protein
MFDENAPKVIKYSHASKGHEFMVDKVLKQEDGVLTHKVFGPAEDDGDGDADGSENGGAVDDAGEADILKTFKHTYVPEVVRESQIHF